MKRHYIYLTLFSTLNRFNADPNKPYPVDPGIRLKDILMDLKVPLDQVKLIFINGKKADLETPLNGGERVGIFPAIGGG